MLKVFKNPVIQIACLLVAWALVCLPNLGISSLWDIDEGNNAEAAYEMMESGNWIVPTYNYNLRVDKPALLYWLQIASYNIFGVNEFSAPVSLCIGWPLFPFCNLRSRNNHVWNEHGFLRRADIIGNARLGRVGPFCQS